MAKLSEDLSTFLAAPERGKEVTIAELQRLAGERGFGLLLLLLSFPSALPVPAPGYSIPFGLLLGLLAVQLLAGRRLVWLPARVQRWSTPVTFAQAVLQKGGWVLRRAELVVRPRQRWVCAERGGRRALGFVVLLMAISMMIPVPGTNTLPAISVFVIGLGLVEDDGLVCLAGIGLGAIATVVTSTILLVGVNLLSQAWQWLRGG